MTILLVLIFSLGAITLMVVMNSGDDSPTMLAIAVISLMIVILSASAGIEDSKIQYHRERIKEIVNIKNERINKLNEQIKGEK